MKFILGFLIIMLGFLSWRFYADPPKHKKNQSHQQRFPQEYMKQVSVDTYTEKGEKKHHISATYWEYQPEKQASLLHHPHLTVYKPDNTIWHMDALQGQVTQPTLGCIEQLELKHNVVIQRPSTAHAIALRLETERLRYLPKKEFAETEERVTLLKSDAKVTGIGMRAYLDKQSVELLKDVQTQFIMSSQ